MWTAAFICAGFERTVHLQAVGAEAVPAHGAPASGHRYLHMLRAVLCSRLEQLRRQVAHMRQILLFEQIQHRQ